MFKKILVIFFLTFTLVAPAQAGVDYYLPYPGILADHPLYWVKMLRDRTQLWLITNKTVKARKLLNYADKRLGGGWALIEGNKKSLGVTTLTKAEKYLDRAVVLGKETEIKETLKKAVQKHAEVLLLLKGQAGDEFNSQFETMLLQVNQQRVELGAEVDLKIEVKINDGEAEAKTATVSAKNALEALTIIEEKTKIKDYEWGKLVEAVGEKQNSAQKAWIYYINGEAGKVAADRQELKSGDKVEWRYEKPLY